MNARNRFFSSLIQESKNSAFKITLYFFPCIICCKK